MLISPPNDKASVGQLLLTYEIFYKNVATYGPLPTKWFRLRKNRFTSSKTEKGVCVPKCRMHF